MDPTQYVTLLLILAISGDNERQNDQVRTVISWFPTGFELSTCWIKPSDTVFGSPCETRKTTSTLLLWLSQFQTCLQSWAITKVTSKGIKKSTQHPGFCTGVVWFVCLYNCFSFKPIIADESKKMSLYQTERFVWFTFNELSWLFCYTFKQVGQHL